MARIRSIHPDACKSERLAHISGDAERCYWRLQTHCDDDGRCEANPRLIWAALFPLHEDIGPDNVLRWLDELEKAELLVQYHVDGRWYLCITQWERFQHPRKPTPSQLPPPDATSDVPVRDECATGVVPVPVGEGVGEGIGEGGTATAVISQRAHRIPAPFIVSPEMESWVRTKCPDLDWKNQTEQFVNYWKAQPGRNAAKLDWERTWRNWMLKNQDWAKTRGPARTHL